MEHEKKKREREEEGEEEEEEKTCSEKNAKKQELICFEDSNILKLSDSFQPLGVFDFPWLKENLVSESEDWNIDDVFSSLLVDTSSTVGNDFSGDCLCQTPTLIDFPGEKLEDESWLSEEDEIDGSDCIWSSVLNQPLSTSFSKVSNA